MSLRNAEELVHFFQRTISERSYMVKYINPAWADNCSF